MNADTQTTESTATNPPAGGNTSPAAKRKASAGAKPRKAGKKSSAKLVRKASDAKPAGKPSPDGTPLKTLLAKLKLPADGRAARRKLRAANFSWHDKRTRWNLNAKQLAQAEKILSE